MGGSFRTLTCTLTIWGATCIVRQLSCRWLSIYVVNNFVTSHAKHLEVTQTFCWKRQFLFLSNNEKAISCKKMFFWFLLHFSWAPHLHLLLSTCTISAKKYICECKSLILMHLKIEPHASIIFFLYVIINLWWVTFRDRLIQVFNLPISSSFGFGLFHPSWSAAIHSHVECWALTHLVNVSNIQHRYTIWYRCGMHNK